MPLDKGSKQDTKEILNLSAKPNKKLYRMLVNIDLFFQFATLRLHYITKMT